ncbi:hypothetical protein [Pseudofrankia asymbiotica]|uniref:Uncharacterized protein n=1 Tax=Pseudofrankia asymbiotica TaxID=1834516 RepID=A0A1V2I559_9ACTN|nr:hypothetical protein [Pseudofrankia asymbiotica]ONH24737.1 hypothetical protein BL253_29370 [Pseudofrankia asymbiotica]
MVALVRRRRSPDNRLSSELVADYGRWKFLDEQSGLTASGIYARLVPAEEIAFVGRPENRPGIIAELRRHATRGPWEKVGAWQYAREFLDAADDTQDLIDGGLLAARDMRVTNLRIHLSIVDTARYKELTGGPVPDDGFFGPPVFDSPHGPTRQFYFDEAVATAAARRPSRVPAAPGVEPGPVDDAVRALWDFGQLVHRGPVLSARHPAFESTVVGPAVAAARDVDHQRFADLVLAKITTPGALSYNVWSALGAARFIEEYLDPTVVHGTAYSTLLGAGLACALHAGDLDRTFPAEILTPRAAARLRELRGR